MSKAPAYQRYSKDYLASVRVQMMTLAEEGAYNRLLEYCWLNGSIPADPVKIARLIGKGCTVEIAKVCLEMFARHPDDSDKMIHDRLERERRKQESNSEARREAAAARWNKGKSEKNCKSGKPAEARGTRDEADYGNGNQVKSKADANALQTDMQNDALHIATAYTSSSSNEKEEDGKPSRAPKKPLNPKAESPPVKAKSPPESHKAWLDRLQAENPHVDIQALFEDYQAHCVKTFVKPTRRHFGHWVAKEEEPMELPNEPYINPLTGRGFE
jgi:uncharacterized protein YdaU (DUF1376 family)